jgi:hypothetical protein
MNGPQFRLQPMHAGPPSLPIEFNHKCTKHNKKIIASGEILSKHRTRMDDKNGDNL